MTRPAASSAAAPPTLHVAGSSPRTYVPSPVMVHCTNSGNCSGLNRTDSARPPQSVGFSSLASAQPPASARGPW
jgi:hypothetical protein